MKVRYASQVLSYIVAASLCTSLCTAAQFVSKFDSLFNCIKSSTIKAPKTLRSAVTKNCTHKGFLKVARTFIKTDCKFLRGNEEVTIQIKCLREWLITLNAIILIWDDLSNNHDFKFLLTRRLKTDPLFWKKKTFLGKMGIVSPTPIQFTTPFTKLSFQRLSSVPQLGTVLMILTVSLPGVQNPQRRQMFEL